MHTTTSFKKRLILIFSVLAVLPWGARGAAIDQIRFADSKSEQAHAFSAVGQVTSKPLHMEIGTFKTTAPAQTVLGKGAAVSFELAVNGGSGPVLLEIQEVHNRRPQVFGYTVLVNEKEVYFRTYEEIADGPNHYFVQVPRGLITGGKARITLRNEGDAPFSLGRVWAYADFEKLAAADGTWRAMPILGNAEILLGFLGEKGKKPSYSDYQRLSGTAADLQPWKEMYAQFAPAGVFTPGFNYQILYPGHGNSDFSIREKVSGLLDLASKAGVTSQFVMHGGEWGGQPSGPDGRGGFFHDLRYSQACFRTISKDYSPTWPGTPGNTIWPTRYEPTLEQFLHTRVERTCRILAQEIGFLQAQGVQLKPVYLMADQGPALWTQGQSFGDFTPEMVAAAQRDGITLDPEDGLSHEERLWMHRNLTRFCSGGGKAMVRGLGRDFIRVAGGKFTLPEHQLNDNLFSHPFFDPSYPCYDDRWAGWQNGVSPDNWTGGETLEKLNPDYYDYVAALGKLTCVNLERGATPNYNYIEKLYQRGFQHVNLYSYKIGDLEPLLKDTVDMEKHPCLPARHHLRKLLDIDFSRDATLGSQQQAVSVDNIELPNTFGKTACLADTSREGSIIYHFSNGGASLPKGVLVRLNFLSKSYVRENPDNSLAVSVGEAPCKLLPVKSVSFQDLEVTKYWPFHRATIVDLGDALAGRSEGYVRITLKTGGKLKPTSFKGLDIAIPWEKTSGHPGGEPFSIRQMRTLRLWTQDRAVFERLVARYGAQGGTEEIAAKAQGMLEEGRPLAATRFLSGEYSHLLPARFAVRGDGPLGRYPLAIKLADAQRTALVELVKAGTTETTLVFTTREPQNCRVQMSGLPAHSRYQLKNQGGNRFSVSATSTGSLIAGADGTLAADLQIKPIPIPGEEGFLAAETGRVPSRKLSAMALGGGSYEVHDPELFEFNPLVITNAPGAKVTRVRDDGQPAPNGSAGTRTADKVELTLNEAGQAIEIKAIYGEVEGKIKSFQPPAVRPVPCNGILELENGNRYELMFRHGFTRLELPGLKDLTRANPIDSYARVLLPGKSVKITYCPYTWKGSLPRIQVLQMEP